MKVVKTEGESVVLVTPDHRSNANAKSYDIDQRVAFETP
jgi:hypothetical protein